MAYIDAKTQYEALCALLEKMDYDDPRYYDVKHARDCADDRRLKEHYEHAWRVREAEGELDLY